MKPSRPQQTPPGTRRRTRVNFAIALTVALSGCASFPRGTDQAKPRSTAPSVKDAAPAVVLDPSQIRDAVPRREARSAYGNPPHYDVYGVRYFTMTSSAGYKETGIASWYGTKFHEKRTSSGEPYDMYAMTAAHKTLPLPTYARVTNLENGRSAIVKINDRGPFHENRVIDLSYAAATKLGILGKGTARVEVEAIAPEAPSTPPLPELAAPTSETKSSVFIQVGAFSERGNAEKLANSLRDLNAPLLVADNSSGTNPTYRVRVGPLRDRSSVAAVVDELNRRGLPVYQIIE